MEAKQRRSGGLRVFNCDSEGSSSGGGGVNMEAKQRRSGGLRVFNCDSEGSSSGG